MCGGGGGGLGIALMDGVCLCGVGRELIMRVGMDLHVCG